MRAEIEAARLDADSIGGIIECAAVGVPAGIGSPMFGGIENVFASILYGIPAVKGVEFGAGFDVACMRGSENNDAFYYDENGLVRTKTNNAGGILGGITTACRFYSASPSSPRRPSAVNSTRSISPRKQTPI